MKALCLPIVSNTFIEKLTKTAIIVRNGNQLLTVWANGDQSGGKAIMANIVINEIGDTFVATNDSKTMNDKGKPVFLKGQTVVRQKQTEEFKSFAGENRPPTDESISVVIGLYASFTNTFE